MKTVSQLMDLKGRAALVTGGAGHIGLAAAEALMELGASVAVVDCQKETCEKRCEDLNSRGYKSKALALTVDVASEKDLRKSVQEAAKALGGLDILVHSAAFVGTTNFPGWVAPFSKQSVEAWDAAMRVNLTAAFVMVQEAEGFLKKHKRGSVIFLSSIHGMVGPDMSLYEGTPMGNPAAYGASKAGLIQLARYLSTTLAPDIRVNAISPGGVWRNQREEFHTRYKKRTPAARMAAEEDLKGAVAYLASDASMYVAGHNLVVDGGYTAW